MMSIPPLDKDLKDWLQAIAWIAAAIGAFVAAIKFWSELRLGREQRNRELRWRQAEAGKSLNDEMLIDQWAWPALQMLDDDGREFELPSKRRTQITHDDLRRALDPSIPMGSVDREKDTYIVECFDSLFYYMSTLEHYISSTLIIPEDVEFPLDYYMHHLSKFRPVVEKYLQEFRLVKAFAFLRRYPAWEGASVEQK